MLTDLPGELLLPILTQALDPADRDSETLESYLRRISNFLRVNKYMKHLTERIVGCHFHMFRPVFHTVAAANAGRSGMATMDQARVGSHLQAVEALFPYLNASLSIHRLPALRTFSLDLTTSRVLDASAAALFNHRCVAILARVATSSFRIEDFSIRLPPVQALIDVLERLVANQHNLHRLRIQVQTASTIAGKTRPRFHLDHLVTTGVVYHPLQVFVLHASSCDVYFLKPPHLQQPFRDRLRLVMEFGMRCTSFPTYIPSWVWVHHFLRSAQFLERCEFTITAVDDHNIAKSRFFLRPITIPHLQDLVVQMPDVDTHLFRQLHAPNLYSLRVRSDVDVGLWPTCGADHFPRLGFVHLQFPGPAILRLLSLGVPLHRFARRAPLDVTAIMSGHPTFTAHLLSNDPQPVRRLEPPYVRNVPTPLSLHPSAAHLDAVLNHASSTYPTEGNPAPSSTKRTRFTH
ncbi:hypothetical protein A4X13_0g3818 [Tilletia indica]|uniref:F-box domain-containing protein n=1 Tax=Tilletia indica TaxID=43049 RepID=A0A177TFT1_9BASI|nr:hypothetical protein A4X13_0g3818 [Tilletia indica]